MTASLIQPTLVMLALLTALLAALLVAFLVAFLAALSYRRHAGIAERLHRLATEVVPQPPGDLAECRFAHNRAVALARPAGLDHVEETARTCRHRADAVGQHGRLVERVGDQQHRRVGAPPQPQHLVAHQEPGLRVERAE